MAKKILKEIKCPDVLPCVKKIILHLFVTDFGFPVLKHWWAEDIQSMAILLSVCIHLKFKVLPKSLLQLI